MIIVLVIVNWVQDIGRNMMKKSDTDQDGKSGVSQALKRRLSNTSSEER